MNLRKLAKGRDCLIRVPGYCCGDRETVVGCHVRLPGISGMGTKADDLFIAWGCHTCHAIVDGQQRSPFTAHERDLMLLEGMVRTQAVLLKEGAIKC